MKTVPLVLLAFLVAGISAGAQEKNSGPLTFVSSDVNPKTLFWIQGRFVPIGDPTYQGDPEVATILCSIRENECLEIDSEMPFPNAEQTWIQDFKPLNWDKNGIEAASRSLDGCTDETLKIHFDPPSVVLVNSPVLPMSQNCKKANNAIDKLAGKTNSSLKSQMEQDMLVPTRGLFPFQDANFNPGKASAPSQKKNP